MKVPSTTTDPANCVHVGIGSEKNIVSVIMVVYVIVSPIVANVLSPFSSYLK